MILLNFIKLAVAIYRVARNLRLKKITKNIILGPYIIPEWTGDELHTCFGCDERNNLGIKLKFQEVGEYGVGAKWEPKDGFESFPNIIHGGIIGTILDEVGGISVLRKYNYLAFTANLNITYHRPVKMGGNIICKANAIAKFKSYVLVESLIIDQESKRVLASMHGLYYIPNKKQFMRSLSLSVLPGSISESVKGAGRCE